MGVSCKRGVVGKQAGAFPRCKVVVPASGLYGDERERGAADALAFAEDVEAVSVVNMQIDDVVELVIGIVVAAAAQAISAPNGHVGAFGVKCTEGYRDLCGASKTCAREIICGRAKGVVSASSHRRPL